MISTLSRRPSCEGIVSSCHSRQMLSLNIVRVLDALNALAETPENIDSSRW